MSKRSSRKPGPMYRSRRERVQWYVTAGAILFVFLAWCFALLGDPLPAGLPATRPAVVGVFLQPRRNLPTWAARGVTVAIGRDREANADGSDGVTLADWTAAARAAGVDYVVEPSADLAADARDPHRKGFLAPYDEPDGKIIDAQDARDAAAEEAVYVTLEQFYARCHAAAPAVPVVLNIDLNQFQYHRSNYPRLFKACDRLLVDYYPVQRGQPVTEYARLVDQLRASPGGAKLAGLWIETSYQHLNPAYFPGKRAPLPAEWAQQVKQATDRGLYVGWFPQQIGEDGAGFTTDATTPEIAAAMTAWLKPAAGGVGSATGAATQPADPIAGTIIILPNGKQYVLQPK